MTSPVSSQALHPAIAGDPRARVAREPRAEVRRLAQQLQAVFVNQLFQAMRASVPADAMTGNAPGAGMFTSLMDEKLASETAQRLQRGLGESLYRQLARRLPGGADPAATPAPTALWPLHEDAHATPPMPLPRERTEADR